MVRETRTTAESTDRHVVSMKVRGSDSRDTKTGQELADEFSRIADWFLLRPDQPFTLPMSDAIFEAVITSTRGEI